MCTHGCCSKSFWDSPLVEGPGRQVHPKTTTFSLVLGFTPSRQPYRAYQSQNDLEQRYSGPSVALPSVLCGTSRPRFAASGFPDLSHQDEKRHSTHFQLLMCDIRKDTCRGFSFRYRQLSANSRWRSEAYCIFMTVLWQIIRLIVQAGPR